MDRNPSWLIFLPKCTCLFPECKNQLPRNGLSLILIVVQFFTLVCHDITHPPYDYRIFCPAHRLKKTNRNSLPNSHSFNTCHSQSTHHNDFSLPAPPSSFNPSNDVKIPPHIRENWWIPCTHSLTKPPHLKHLFPLALRNLVEAICMTRASSVKSINYANVKKNTKYKKHLKWKSTV